MSTAENCSDDATGTPDQAAPAPTVKQDRLHGLDFTRGVAVLGILAANIVAFGQPFSAYMWPDAFLTADGDDSGWMWIAQFVLIDGKMRGLFTLLFGAGMVLFMEKAWTKGATRWLQARRLLFLLMFGLIHFYLIWRGDILILYSVAGSIAMLCLRWKAKTLLVVGSLGYFIGAIISLAFMTLPYFVAETSFGEQNTMVELRNDLSTAKTEVRDIDFRETAILTEGSYSDFVEHMLDVHLTGPLDMLKVFWMETLPLMLIGMGLFKVGFFNGGIDPGKQRKWAWVGIIVGTVLTIPIALWAVNAGLTYWGTIAAFMGFAPLPRLPVIIGLAALLTLWGASTTGWLAERFIAAGRMAFTNYLGTSMLMVLVFHPWAGGLFGDLNRAQLYLVVLLTWVVMLLWSKPWLERFRYGPLEWLWRCLTYGKLFPLKR